MNIKHFYKKLLKLDRKINYYIKMKERKNSYFFFEIFVYILGSYIIITFVLRLMHWIT